jgi:hypothetical protein
MAEGPYNPGHTIIDLRTRSPYSGDGEPPGSGMLEARVKTLEDKVDRLLQDTAEIKGLLRASPSAAEFGELKGRVNSLPTTSKVSAIVAIAVGVLSLVAKWGEISDLLG